MDGIVLVKDVNGDFHPVKAKDLPRPETIYGMSLAVLAAIREEYMIRGGDGGTVTVESVHKAFAQ